MTDFDKNLPLAMTLAAVDEKFAEPCIWFNGYCINLTDSEDLELLRVLVQHKPLRDQLEELSTTFATA